MPFSKLGLTPSLCSPLARLGYEEPTPIQVSAIPVILSGADVLARAQTGTGKTAAFGLPMIDRLRLRSGSSARRTPRGLVLVPTRELAAQVHRALSTYGVPANLRVTPIFGGASMSAQIQALQRGTDIIVATPGRLIDHLQRRTVDLSAVEVLTLDEADRMLDMGFLPALKRINTAVPRTRQTLLFSATLGEAVVRLSAEFTRQPTRVDVSDRHGVASSVTHHVHPVALDHKRELLKQLLTQPGDQQALVFCKTKRGSDRVGEYLEGAGVKAAVIHGNKSQGARTRALDHFKTGRVAVLVATDVAARGLDIANLPLVINYDLPLVAEDYIHRIGRTGRAGRSGRAVSLVSPSDSHLLRDIQRLLPGPIEHSTIAGFEMTHARPDAPVRAHERGRSRHAQPHGSAGGRHRQARPNWVQKKSGTGANRRSIA